jgi:hypothetical protein
VVFEVERGQVEEARVVSELAQSAVTVEAQQRSHGTRFVVVIHVGRWRGSADRADAVLFREHEVGLGS